MKSKPAVPTIMLRRKQVEARTGLSRSTIYLKMSRGEFPSSISLGERAVAWTEASIEKWLQQRIKESA